jgi:hypothetical protein
MAVERLKIGCGIIPSAEAHICRNLALNRSFAVETQQNCELVNKREGLWVKRGKRAAVGQQILQSDDRSHHRENNLNRENRSLDQNRE